MRMSKLIVAGLLASLTIAPTGAAGADRSVGPDVIGTSFPDDFPVKATEFAKVSPANELVNLSAGNGKQPPWCGSGRRASSIDGSGSC